MLFVLERVDHKCNKRHNYYYRCRCDCGKTVEMLKWVITNGKTKGCGCQKFKTGKKHWGFIGYEEIHGNIWTMIKKNARTRNIPFEISIQYAWNLFLEQNRKCALTGESIEFPKRIKGDSRTASLDRIDSDKGYVKGNVQWVHKNINMMKQEHSTNSFFDWCVKVCLHNNLLQVI
jgi:hypothetical protein